MRTSEPRTRISILTSARLRAWYYHCYKFEAERFVGQSKGKRNQMKRYRTYFLVRREGYAKPFPDYDQLAKTDEVQATKLPVTERSR